jgi:carboxymethylenebutenolidase
MTQSQPLGFLAVPPMGKGPGVLVLHAWWGLNDTFKAFCTQLAESGFVAFAPDLYHGKVAATIQDAKSLTRTLDEKQAKADIAEAIAFLRERATGGHEFALVGFSLGASHALDLATTDPEGIRAVVIFYATGGGDFSRSKAEYLGHFAETDEFESDADVDALEGALRAAGRPVTFYHYKGTGHWFFERDREGAYNQDAAALAWERTLSFLRRTLPVGRSQSGAAEQLE